MNYPLRRLPLVDFLLRGYPRDLLSDACVIACQHVLPSTHLMFRSLFDMGLMPERTFVIGKCYSTSKAVVKNMINEGISVSPHSESFDSSVSFDEQFQRYLETFILEAKDQIAAMKKPKTILVFDDGGELLKLVNQHFSESYNVVGVEQTTSGFNKLQHMGLSFPVANVARSWAKLKYESPMIARSQTMRILAYLQKMDHKPEKCLIIGNGAIGENLYESLKYYFTIDRFDHIAERSTIENLNGNLKDYDIVIGATGKRLFQDFSELKEGVILINASSSDREFPAELLRAQCGKIDDCHTDVNHNGIFMPNGGFPINFKGGDFDTVPLENIQLTIGLLLLGALCILDSPQRQQGMVEVGIPSQKKLIAEFGDIGLYPDRRDSISDSIAVLA